MKILIVTDYYPPFMGGAHRQSWLLAHEMKAKGHQVTVATNWQLNIPTEEEDDGINVHRLHQLRTILPGQDRNQNQRHAPPFADPVLSLGLRRLIQTVQPDLIHSYGWISFSCALALIGNRKPALLISDRDFTYYCVTRRMVYKGKPCTGPHLSKCVGCAMAEHGSATGLAGVLGIHLFRGLLQRRLDGVHYVSRYVQQQFRSHFLKNEHQPDSSLVEEIVPSFRSEAYKSRHASPKNLNDLLTKLPRTPYILYVGALRYVKGINQLLQAYQQLKSPPPLVLVGTIEPTTPKEFPPGVIVVGRLPNQAVLKAWDGCLFGVIPSLWPEPFGSVVHEGLSRGKPVIGTKPGGHEDMITDGVNGLLVPAGDVSALTAAMQRLLDDPDLREKLSAAAQQGSDKFTAAVSVPRFENLYRTVTAKRGVSL